VPKHYSTRVRESSYPCTLSVLSSITYPLSVLGMYFVFWVCFLSFPVTDHEGWTRGRGERRMCVSDLCQIMFMRNMHMVHKTLKYDNFLIKHLFLIPFAPLRSLWQDL
jgi:hypothetical protein